MFKRIVIALSLLLIVSGALWLRESLAYPEYSKHDIGRPALTPPPTTAAGLAEFDRIVPWAHALTASKNVRPETATILLKAMRVFKEGEAEPVYEEEYDHRLTLNRGALFERFEGWKEDKQEIFNQQVTPDGLVIDMREYSAFWLHFWTTRIPYQRGEKYRIEVDAALTGDVFIQFGIDYYRGDGDPPDKDPAWGFDATCRASHRCEGMISKWYKQTNGKVVTFVFKNY